MGNFQVYVQVRSTWVRTAWRHLLKCTSLGTQSDHIIPVWQDTPQQPTAIEMEATVCLALSTLYKICPCLPLGLRAALHPLLLCPLLPSLHSHAVEWCWLVLTPGSEKPTRVVPACNRYSWRLRQEGCKFKSYNRHLCPYSQQRCTQVCAVCFISFSCC